MRIKFCREIIKKRKSNLRCFAAMEGAEIIV